MDTSAILAALEQYQGELTDILRRFRRTPDSISIAPPDSPLLRTVVTEITDLLNDHVPGSGHHSQQITNSYNHGLNNYFESPSYASVEEIRSTVSAVLTRIRRNPALFDSAQPIGQGADIGKLLDALDRLIFRFHLVAVQLRTRHAGRPSLDVSDEYDVQDLLHALLRLYFDDVRPEEWTPSYAGASSRTDFLLPQIDTVVEVKKTRPGLTSKLVGEQLIIDIARYKKHPQCRRLICFVYDPDGRVSNPAGLESDLIGSGGEIEVQVCIVPRLRSE